MTYQLGIIAICVFIFGGFPSAFNAIGLTILALLIVRRAKEETK